MSTATEAPATAASQAMARVAAGLVLGLLALVPLLVSSNVADMLTRVLAFALLAIGLDLLAGVGGEAVEDDCPLLGGGKEVGVELVGTEVGEPLPLLLLVAHADPDVRI